jgi:hypothetical protein
MNSFVETSVADATTRTGLYESDRGRLPLDTRLVLCKLLTGPSIEPGSPHWPALLRDEDIVRERLSDVFLDLVLDRERMVAFTRQADTGELDTPVLLRRKPLSFLDSILILHLRQLLVEADTNDQRAVVDESALVEYLEVYREPDSDSVSMARHIAAAINRMKVNNILQSVRGFERRFEVSPTLRLLFSADDAEALTQAYRRLGQGQGSDTATASEEDHESV